MVDLVGIDVNMSNITNIKILILVPSTALTVCFIEPLSAVIFFITMFSTTYNNMRQLRAG